MSSGWKQSTLPCAKAEGWHSKSIQFYLMYMYSLHTDVTLILQSTCRRIDSNFGRHNGAGALEKCDWFSSVPHCTVSFASDPAWTTSTDLRLITDYSHLGHQVKTMT